MWAWLHFGGGWYSVLVGLASVREWLHFGGGWYSVFSLSWGLASIWSGGGVEIKGGTEVGQLGHSLGRLMLHACPGLNPEPLMLYA